MRRTAGLSFALLGLAVPAGADAALPSCGSLKGKDLAPSSPAKVVDRSGTLVVCTSTRGRAKPLPGGGRGVDLLDARAATAAVRTRATRAVHVVDLVARTRRRLRIGGLNPSGPVLVGRAGEAAAFLGNGASRRLVGFDVDGTSYGLAGGEIPASSLRRAGNDVIRWDGGRADLTTPRVPCDRLSGTEVFETATVRVTTIRFRASYLVGELDGTATRFRACALDGDAVRVLDEPVNPTGGVQGGADFAVLAAGGTFVLSRSRTESSEADITSSLTVTDLATGNRTPLPDLTSGTRQPATDAVLTPTGEVAVVVEDGDTVRLLAQRLGGTVRELDAAPHGQFPNTKLTLAGTVVGWTRGEPRSFDLATL